MAVEMCIESAGWIVHAIETGSSSALLSWRRLTTLSISAVKRSAAPVPPAPSRSEQVRRVAASLPFDQARALWLVDTCGYTYDEAGRATNHSWDVVAQNVSEGRQAIRAALVS